MLPLVVVFGGWVEFRSLSKQRKEYLDSLLEASSLVRHQDLCSKTFRRWSVFCSNNYLLQYTFNCWIDNISKNNNKKRINDTKCTPSNNGNTTTTTAAAATTTTATTISSNVAFFQLKSIFFSRWQSYTADELLVQHHKRSHIKYLLFQYFIKWTNWSNDSKQLHHRHDFAFKTVLRNRKHRALSQWRLSTRLSLVEKGKERTCPKKMLHHSTTNTLETATISIPRSVNEVRLEQQHRATTILVPLLQNVLVLKVCWYKWLLSKYNLSNALTIQQATMERKLKIQLLSKIPLHYILYRKRRQHLIKRIFRKWRAILTHKNATCQSFRLRTIGKRCFNRWLFVHVQRKKAKIIHSPTLNYEHGRKKREKLFNGIQIQRLARRLYLPNRSMKKKEIFKSTEEENTDGENSNDKDKNENNTETNNENNMKNTNPRNTDPLIESPKQNIRPLFPPPFSVAAPVAISPDISILRPVHEHSIWSVTFDHLSIGKTNDNNRNNTALNSLGLLKHRTLSGDVVLELLCRIGAFTKGNYRAIFCKKKKFVNG
jgi:hypothetical protein